MAAHRDGAEGRPQHPYLYQPRQSRLHDPLLGPKWFLQPGRLAYTSEQHTPHRPADALDAAAGRTSTEEVMKHVTQDEAFDALCSPEIPPTEAIALFKRAYRRSNEATKAF